MIKKNSKLLILGGTHQQIKFVRAAQRKGIYTIVTDYLPDSPAKRISDKSYDINITDIDALEKMCKEEEVDAVICGYIDPCQRPYQQLCDRLSLHCYGTFEQFMTLTDKHDFKRLCRENKVDIILEYSQKDIAKKEVEFPVFVKPVDSRGSRGQQICFNYDDLDKAIKNAKTESSNGDILVEKYMEHVDEFQVTYFFINGEAYLLRTADCYGGSKKNNLEKVISYSVSPSEHTELFLKKSHDNVVRMLKKLGIKNGPVFMQGFVDNGVFRFFDPGFRFPGVDYEKIFKKIFKVDFAELLVDFAINGVISPIKLPDNGVYLDNHMVGILFPTVKPGIVKDISCFERISKHDYVTSCIPRVKEGQKIDWFYNINQRVAEIDVLASGKEDLYKKLKKIQKEIVILDENNENMLLEIL